MSTKSTDSAADLPFDTSHWFIDPFEDVAIASKSGRGKMHRVDYDEDGNVVPKCRYAKNLSRNGKSTKFRVVQRLSLGDFRTPCQFCWFLTPEHGGVAEPPNGHNAVGK